MQDAIKALQDSLWSDFNSARDFPQTSPLIAHYTSISTLESILKNEEIWLSNPLYMNDINELDHGMKKGIELIESSHELRQKIPDNSYREFINYASDLFFHIDKTVSFDTYLTCFCEHEEDDNDGLLSMWRGYGANGNGAAIVFNLGKIENNQSSPIKISKVEYLTSEEFTNKIREYIVSTANILEQFPSNSAIISQASSLLLQRILMASLLTKHKGFSEEKEWRMFYLKKFDQNNELTSMLSYSILNEKLAPKLKLKIKPLNGATHPENITLENLIEKIILGPCTESKFTRKTFERMLDTMGKSSLAKKLFCSTIPYRS
ncbi:DUF2971 domain-containing protein [Chromobacterium vaccinii]|uniref:DUF2971 domain-containing protein n=1 Tax=Chromobacterium vaccinii TaxID=1108595 RepID=UPI003C74CA12